MGNKSQWQREKKKNRKVIIRQARTLKYNKWGYIFLIPFFAVFILCTLIPQIMTIGNSFFENYKEGLNQVGPNFVGLKNYIAILAPNSRGDVMFLKYFGNTVIIWLLGAVPQFVIAMLLALIFTSSRLNVKGMNFFKTVMYMPNLIMASAFSMLFYNLFSNVGPINQLLGLFGEGATIDFFSKTVTVRALIALMNFIMWFGNTSLVLMAGIMSIDESVFEAAAIDGAKATKVFWNVTVPMLKPMIVYSVITAMIGGLQMFDVPQILTDGMGTPSFTSKTLVMSLNGYLGLSKNYGMSGAISVLMFILSAIMSVIVYKALVREGDK